MGAHPSKPQPPSTLKMIRDNSHGIIDIILLLPSVPASNVNTSDLETLIEKVAPRYVPQYDENGSGQIVGGCWHRVLAYKPIQLSSNEESEAGRLSDALMGDVAGRKRDLRKIVFAVFDGFGRDVVRCLLSNSRNFYIDVMCQKRPSRELILGIVGFDVDLKSKLYATASVEEVCEKRITSTTEYGSFKELCTENRVLRREIRCGDVPSGGSSEKDEQDEEAVKLERSLENLVRLSEEVTEGEKEDADLEKVKAAFLSMTDWEFEL